MEDNYLEVSKEIKMNDQIKIELLKTIRTLANSKLQPQHIYELIELNKLIINNILNVKIEARMTSFGERKIQVIKVIREWTGFDLKRAKDFVENIPAKLELPDNPEKINNFINDLKKAGAIVEIY